VLRALVTTVLRLREATVRGISLLVKGDCDALLVPHPELHLAVTLLGHERAARSTLDGEPAGAHDLPLQEQQLQGTATQATIEAHTLFESSPAVLGVES